MEIAVRANAKLAEGPRWDAATGRLLWVDIEACELHVFESGEDRAIGFEAMVGAAAAVLESHLAYPMLVFFRSSHDNEAWLNSFGAVMDAAVLVMSTVDDKSEGPAKLMYRVGNHLVEDLSWYFRRWTPRSTAGRRPRAAGPAPAPWPA